MNKKLIGTLLITAGILFIFFITFRVFAGNNDNDLVSPIPDQKGINVIYITPKK